MNTNKKFDFDKYMDHIYDHSLINSLLFTSDLDKNVYDYVDLAEDMLDGIYKRIIIWMKQNKGSCLFDEFVKNNLYFFSDLVLNKNDKLSKEERTEKINYVKLYINQCNLFYPNYIREQFYMRFCGIDIRKSNSKLLKMTQYGDEQMLNIRDEIYKSISYDIDFVDMFFTEKDKFYNERYNNYLLYDKFYLSLNYYILSFPIMLRNRENFARVKYIIDKSLEKLCSNYQENYSENLFRLMNKSQKLVKKFGKREELFFD